MERNGLQMQYALLHVMHGMTIALCPMPQSVEACNLALSTTLTETPKLIDYSFIAFLPSSLFACATNADVQLGSARLVKFRMV